MSEWTFKDEFYTKFHFYLIWAYCVFSFRTVIIIQLPQMCQNKPSKVNLAQNFIFTLFGHAVFLALNHWQSSHCLKCVRISPQRWLWPKISFLPYLGILCGLILRPYIGCNDTLDSNHSKMWWNLQLKARKRPKSPCLPYLVMPEKSNFGQTMSWPHTQPFHSILQDISQ